MEVSSNSYRPNPPIKDVHSREGGLHIDNDLGCKPRGFLECYGPRVGHSGGTDNLSRAKTAGTFVRFHCRDMVSTCSIIAERDDYGLLP